jgi:hypothetical protein
LDGEVVGDSDEADASNEAALVAASLQQAVGGVGAAGSSHVSLVTVSPVLYIYKELDGT